VIRGEDHLSNTAKHIALFRAFGVEPPQYAHIPLILNKDGSKMSKRDRGASLSTYTDEGFVAAAVVNYLCLLGWSPKDNREKLPLNEVIQRFDLPQILRHNAKFDMDKLEWLAGEYMREVSDAEFQARGAEAFRSGGCALENYSADYLKAALDTCKGKVKKFSDLPAYAGFYFHDDVKLDAAALAKDFTPENKPRVQRLRDAFAALPEFATAALEQTLKSVAAEFGVKAGVLVHPARLAVTGGTAGPSLYHLLEILGRERVLTRLDRALSM
jgi:glutamyl-tRNA synthetase